ncbi:MAG TPA: hypothetical protein VKV19_13525 [Ktedonobacteraceae bacterium]|nr:hypothetical protein [Ktedonobacteraceae bacterium]
MSEMVGTVTLWLAWYREQAEKEHSGRSLRLKMLYAGSREEARAEIQQWLKQRGLLANNLERLEPSPYGLQFQRR